MTWRQQAAEIIAEATRALPDDTPPALPDRGGRRGAHLWCLGDALKSCWKSRN